MAVVRTRVYVDGFNLYYRAVKGTPYKWLDIKKLCEEMLPADHDINCIKYFTARVHSTRSDPTKRKRQNLYITALQKIFPETEVFYGHFSRHLTSIPLAPSDLKKLPPGTIVSRGYTQSPINKQWVSKEANFGTHVDIVKTEEKGSDVNLAIHLLDDAWKDEYDTAIIISNDSDLAGAIDLVKTHGKTIGIINAAGVPTKELREKADFHRRISPRYLKKAQLPDRIPGTKIYKPKEWNKATRAQSNKSP